MLKVAITGGVGTGKTYIARLFELLDIDVFYADIVAKKLIQQDVQLRNVLKEISQGNVFSSQGELDKNYLFKTIILENSTLSKQMNHLIHQATIKKYDQWVSLIAQKNSQPYCIKESAILFEANAHKKIDFIIGIDAPESLCKQRYLSRPSSSQEKLNAIRKKQLRNYEKMKLVDLVIKNDNQIALMPQVIKVHQLLISKATPIKKN